jgi:stage II sporulation protein D
MNLRNLILILISAVLAGGCSRLSYVDRQAGIEQVPHPHIRVRILETKSLQIKSDGTYRINCITADSSSKGYYTVSPLKIESGSDGLILSENNGYALDKNLRKMYISPRNRDSHLIIDDRPFRGIMEVWSVKDSLEVINVLNIEDYLKGVLPPEIGHLEKDAYEALKAQSVAARTYAYSRISANGRKPYDLVNDIMDQVYQGLKGEYDLANQAINATRGEILAFQGEQVTAYYHSTCGGHTEDVANVWEQNCKDYLKSIDDSDYCHWSKFYEWEMTWEPFELAGYLREYLQKERDYKDGPIVIRDIRVNERFPSGRISQLEVLTDKGEFLFFKDQIRWAFRRPGHPEQILPSSNFEIRMWSDTDGQISEITASGRGYGHGVGMCQTGAIGRARAGQSYDYILKKYYSGVEIKKAY